jgi:chromosome segregation ATPase
LIPEGEVSCRRTSPFLLTEGGKNHNIFVINETDETMEQTTENNAVLRAIAELSKKFENRFDALEQRFDTLEKDSNAQFEAIREGIVFNNNRFDRLSAEVYDARAEIARLRVSFSEFTEEIRQSQKSLV